MKYNTIMTDKYGNKIGNRKVSCSVIFGDEIEYKCKCGECKNKSDKYKCEICEIVEDRIKKETTILLCITCDFSYVKNNKIDYSGVQRMCYVKKCPRCDK